MYFEGQLLKYCEQKHFVKFLSFMIYLIRVEHIKDIEYDLI